MSSINFSHEFTFDLTGIAGFFAKIFRLGNAEAELEVKSVRKATVQLGGLSHNTIKTGALIDYLLYKKPSSSCMRDILDQDHFTVVAALKANTFTYEFSDSTGTVVKFSAPEVNGLFQGNANVNIQVASDGKIVVTFPTYVGFIAGDGERMAKELEKAKAPGRFGVAPMKPTTALVPFASASPSTIMLVEHAVRPAELRKRRLASLEVNQFA